MRSIPPEPFWPLVSGRCCLKTEQPPPDLIATDQPRRPPHHELIRPFAALCLSFGPDRPVTGVDFRGAVQDPDLRVVTWNIDADTGGGVGQMGGVDGGPGLAAVLQAIGQEHLNGNAQPIDVLALEELNGTGANAANATNATLEYVVGQLNAIYGAGTYAYDTTTDPTDGSSETGNGPSGLIYNTKTVTDLGRGHRLGRWQRRGTSADAISSRSRGESER